MFSASSETRDRNAPTNANQIRLQTSRIRQEHRPIRYQLPARLSFRQGQVEFLMDDEDAATGIGIRVRHPRLHPSILSAREEKAKEGEIKKGRK
jgi:hypothetical protein